MNTCRKLITQFKSKRNRQADRERETPIIKIERFVITIIYTHLISQTVPRSVRLRSGSRLKIYKLLLL